MLDWLDLMLCLSGSATFELDRDDEDEWREPFCWSVVSGLDLRLRMPDVIKSNLLLLLLECSGLFGDSGIDGGWAAFLVPLLKKLLGKKNEVSGLDTFFCICRVFGGDDARVVCCCCLSVWLFKKSN